MFFNHLKEKNQCYFTHLKNSLEYSFISLKSCLYFLIHGIYPDIFTNKGSNEILFLNSKLNKKIL